MLTRDRQKFWGNIMSEMKIDLKYAKRERKRKRGVVVGEGRDSVKGQREREKGRGREYWPVNDNK